MNTRILVLAAAGLLVLAGSITRHQPVVAQDGAEDLIKNPDLTLPPTRVDQNVQYSLREARQREIEAITLEREGKKDEALDKWRDAMARYETLRREKLDPDMPVNTELLVRAEWPTGNTQNQIAAETWQPLADYINSRYRIQDWPRPLRDQLALRQAAPGAELLQRALADVSEPLLRRCARFYQFSESGRTALRLLAEKALERGDAVLAVRWLYELQASWPDYYLREPMLQVLYVRACRDAGMNYRLGRELRRREYEGAGGRVTVGGDEMDSAKAVAALTGGVAPQARPELMPNGWLTLQGDGTRNGVAPPISGIGEAVDLDSDEKLIGLKLADKIPGADEAQPDRYSGRESSALPVIFPSVHDAGFFVHKIDEAGGSDEKLMWVRHGRESSPVTLEVPSSERYRTKQNDQGNRYFWYSNQQTPREKYRVMGSTIARVRWDLDNRESDLLFAVMGPGTASREHGSEPTGNQIQIWNVSDDCALRVTLPNRKVETESEIGFLRHVAFKGAPLVRGNKLYIAGAVTEKDSIEFWMFCFDVTPKGDAAAGEGKLQWRVHLCSKRQESNIYWRGNQAVTLPEISSPSEQGGMVYVSTHAGATAAVDRVTGELCWVSKYGRAGIMNGGWFPGPAVSAAGMLVTTPYDYSRSLILDAVWGTLWMDCPPGGKGPGDDFEYVLGVADNCMIIQGRTRIYSVALTSFRKGGTFHADFGRLEYQSAEFGKTTIGRGVIAGDKVLVPFEGEIAFYDLQSGKLLSRPTTTDLAYKKGDVFTLTVYCRGEAYKDEQGMTRYGPVTLTDPDTGNVYNVEHLPNGAEFKFPSGKTGVVKKETFIILASARTTYLFKAEDGGR